MAINTNTNLQNSYTTAISLRTSELLAEKPFLKSIVKYIDVQGEGRTVFRNGNTVRVLRDPIGVARDVNDDLSANNTFDQPAQPGDEISLDFYRAVNFNWGQKDATIGTDEVTINRYAGSGAKTIENDIEKNVLAELVNDANIPAGNEIGVVANALDAQTLAHIQRRFDDLGVAEEDRILLLSPKHKEDLLNASVLTSADFVSKGSIETGDLSSKLYSMTVIVSAKLATNDNLAGVTGTQEEQISLAFDKQSALFGMAEIAAPLDDNVKFAIENIDGFVVAVTQSYEHAKRRNLLSMDVLYGCKMAKRPSVITGQDECVAFPILGGK